LLTKK